MVVMDSESPRKRKLRSGDELRAAVDKAVQDACAADPAQGRGLMTTGTSIGGSPGSGQPTKKKLKGVQSHVVSTGKRRGGWFNRCQLVMEALLAGHQQVALDLADQFYTGDGDY